MRKYTSSTTQQEEKNSFLQTLRSIQQDESKMMQILTKLVFPAATTTNNNNSSITTSNQLRDAVVKLFPPVISGIEGLKFYQRIQQKLSESVSFHAEEEKEAILGLLRKFSSEEESIAIVLEILLDFVQFSSSTAMMCVREEMMEILLTLKQEGLVLKILCEILKNIDENNNDDDDDDEEDVSSSPLIIFVNNAKFRDFILQHQDRNKDGIILGCRIISLLIDNLSKKSDKEKVCQLFSNQQQSVAMFTKVLNENNDNKEGVQVVLKCLRKLLGGCSGDSKENFNSSEEFMNAIKKYEGDEDVSYEVSRVLEVILC